MDLAEDSTQGIGWRGWVLRGAVALAVAALVGFGAIALKGWVGSDPPPKRQVARIAILPDTPPPPPPPPKEEKPPPPRDEARPMPQQPEAPKPAEAPPPADAPLKMEGAAGTGPSAFAAGTVSREYSGGPVNAGAQGGGAAAAADRAQQRLYANTARQMLRDEIERHFRSQAAQASAEFTLWVERDGAIRRIELVPTGNAALDGELQAALDETRTRLRLPQPPAEQQPMRFRLTLRPQG